MKSKLYLPLLLCLLALTLPRYAYSQIEGAPHKIDYQGHLLDNGGASLSPGAATNYTIEFRIYDAQSQGHLLWAEQQVVTVSDGDFSVRLGEGAATIENVHPDLDTVFNQRERYLGITVKVANQQSGEIVPRLAFLTAPYSFAAERAKTADSVTQAAGTSTLGTTQIFDLTVTGSANVSGNNYLEFGNGVSSKNADAGKIGYELFSTDSLDIVGAGTSSSNRKVKFFAEAGAQFNGAVAAPSFNGGTFTGTSFTGDGSNLTSIKGSNLTPASVDTTKLIAAVQNALCPAGTIVAYAGTTAPQGWLMCDGNLVNRSDYPNLFNVIGTSFGYTVTSNSDFRVPDFRGRFLRGRDAGTGRDPDRGGRFASNNGGASGDAVGSLQGDELRSHSHNYWDIYYSEAGGSVSLPFPFKGSSGSDNDNGGWQIYRTSDPAGGNETRPVNVSVNYIIKF
jgi:hypothetical protein